MLSCVKHFIFILSFICKLSSKRFTETKFRLMRPWGGGGRKYKNENNTSLYSFRVTRLSYPYSTWNLNDVLQHTFIYRRVNFLELT